MSANVMDERGGVHRDTDLILRSRSEIGTYNLYTIRPPSSLFVRSGFFCPRDPLIHLENIEYNCQTYATLLFSGLDITRFMRTLLQNFRQVLSAQLCPL